MIAVQLNTISCLALFSVGKGRFEEEDRLHVYSQRIIYWMDGIPVIYGDLLFTYIQCYTLLSQTIQYIYCYGQIFFSLWDFVHFYHYGILSTFIIMGFCPLLSL